MKPTTLFTSLCGILGSAGALAAAEIDVFNDNTLTQFSTATPGGYGTNIRVLNGSQTWTKDNIYFLTDRVFIPNGVTLTIEAGTRIYGSSNDNATPGTKTDDKVGSLVACRGGRIVAVGTATEPIVFTSIREYEALTGLDSAFDPDTVVGPAPGPADAGHWGGVVMLGNSRVVRVNASGVNAGTTQIEGFIPSGSYSQPGDTIPDATQYGVSSEFPLDLADDSGELKYVSIRHGGYEFATGSEINGLTLGGVGSGTKISYVEVYANQDDGIEFFGGTVNTSNIVMAFNQDDSFDLDEGFTGTHQFWFAIQNPGIADGGGEWDGVGGTAAGFNLGDAVNNWSKPLIYNATFVGPGRNYTTFTQMPNVTGQINWEKGNFAMNIEDYFNGEIYNSVFDDFSQGFIRFIDNGLSTGTTPKAENNVVGRFGSSASFAVDGNFISGTNQYELFFDAFGDPVDGNTAANTNPGYTAYSRNASGRLLSINPIPAPGSPMLTQPVSSGAPVPVNYRGAFGTVNWTHGWSKVWQAGFVQGPAPATGGSGQPPFADVDNDGVSDTLEASPALAALGFSVGTNDTARFNSIYTEAAIQDLVTGSQVMIQASGGNVNLSLPVFKSGTLNNDWIPAGSLQLTIPQEGDKQFYRIDIGN